MALLFMLVIMGGGFYIGFWLFFLNSLFSSGINTSYPGLVLPPAEHISWQAIFTVSPSNIVSISVSGHITDSHSGLPITGATVQIGPLSVLSDANGYYSQSNLPPATYTATASANNYVSLTNTVTTSSSQKNVTKNFALSTLPDPKSVVEG